MDRTQEDLSIVSWNFFLSFDSVFTYGAGSLIKNVTSHRGLKLKKEKKKGLKSHLSKVFILFLNKTENKLFQL